MDQTARLSLPLLMPGQAQKHITHNLALALLDVLVQPIVLSRSLGTPPVSPLSGDAYIIPASASGVWAGHTDEIAAYQGNAWQFIDPAEGFQLFDRASDSFCVFTGSAWVVLASTGSGLKTLGVNASADAVNRLTVAAEASLFSHEGEGHQVKINKAEAEETASLLFQSDWLGHAEMGLMGDNSWRIKVSDDGESWLEALTIDASNANINFAGGLRPALDNAKSLGASGARWAAVWSATGTIQTSDAREKHDILDSPLGLDFIRALRPVSFCWNDATTLERQGRHYGFIAQDVLAVVAQKELGAFAGLVLPETDEQPMALRYDQFIAPLVAAVQSLAEAVEMLTKKAGH